MGNLGDIEIGTTIKLLLLGDSGAGKTCGACSFPGPLYLADFDGKANSAAAYYKNNPEVLKNVEVVNYKPTAEMPFPAKFFNQEMARVKKCTPFPYKTIVIDSITTFVDETLRWLMHENPQIKRPESKLVKLSCMTDYGILQLYLKELLGYILAFPCNVIFTAHIETTKDETTGQIVRSPLMPGKLATKLPIYFEEVWRLYAANDGKRMVQTDPDSRFSICRRQLPVPKEFEFSYDNIKKFLTSQKEAK